ncbi:hypothetical protein TNCV_3207581 [Trichonephila clavipes]|nr:hypothetical protein TNCV_3207581 [Trichonephila clavipes]
MDQIDAFPEHISTTVMPVTLPEKPDALEYAARQGHRAILEAKHVNEFRPDDVLWEKIPKGLLRNPDRLLKNTDKRMVYIYNNIFFVKKDFTFGFRTVKSGEIHLIQTTHVPMRIYEFPSSSLRCRANPNLFRRSFEPFDQMLYHRMVLEPHTAYPIPKKETLRSKCLQATTSDPGSCTCRDKRKAFGTTALPFSKKKRVFITPVIRPPVAPVLIARPFTALSTPQPVSISEPPELTTPQILLPDPPPELTSSQIILPDPPSKQTTPQILLPDPPVVETTFSYPFPRSTI